MFLVAGSALAVVLRAKNLPPCYSRAENQALEISVDSDENASDVDDTGAWLALRSTAVLAGWRGRMDLVPDGNQIDALLDGADLCRPPPRLVGCKALI